MNVEQVIARTKEWVQSEGSRIPGFCGAYLVGSINEMPSDEYFPHYRDVDLHVVLQDGGKSSEENLEISCDGLILECGFKGLEEYSSPEAVLANPHIAPNLAVNSILSDPTGHLKEVHEAVARAFSRRQWVIARCAYEKERSLGHLELLHQAKAAFEAIREVYWTASFMAGLIAVASLRTPTHRKALVLLKELLQQQGHLDLHEKLLDLLGYRHLQVDRVNFYLQECAAAFDCAIEVKQTPSYWDMKLRPHIRPYAIEGAQEMIDAGYHREAMFWITVFLGISIAAIQTDAPDADRRRFLNTFGQLLQDVGTSTPEDWHARYLQANALKDEFFDAADIIVQRNPNIID